MSTEAILGIVVAAGIVIFVVYKFGLSRNRSNKGSGKSPRSSTPTREK